MAAQATIQLHPRAEAVLRYWLGAPVVDSLLASPPRPAAWPADKEALWFRGAPAVDDEIKGMFGGDLRAMAAGEYDAWADPAAGHPLNTLAGIVLGDQFARNVHRGTKDAFALDPKALAWARALAGCPPFTAWPLCCKMWAFLPLEHSESLEDQERCVELFTGELERLRAAAADSGGGGGSGGGESPGGGAAPPGAELKAAASFVDYAAAHRDVIARWGRFPHRNALLGRESTPEERAGLADGSIRAF